MFPWRSTACALVFLFSLPSASSAQTKIGEPALNVRLKTKHYALGGTVSEARLREYGRLLEFIYSEYEKGFDILLAETESKSTAPAKADRARGSRKPEVPKANETARKPGSEKSTDKKGSGDAENEIGERFPVAIFLNTREYQAQTRQHLGHNAEHTIGMFIPATRMLLIADQGNTRDTQEVLFHEAFHQFLDKHVADPPMWLNEGLAMHYGSAMPAGKGIEFTNIPTDRWKLAREAVEDKKAIPLVEVVNATRERFYDKTPIRIDEFDNVTRSSLYYAQAYTIVHMLLNDPDGKKRLQNYIRDLARDRGNHTAEITARYFDEKACTSLSPHWIKYVKAGPRGR